MYKIYFITNNGKFVYKNKTWNNLVTHWKMFATHKCVSTPHLRNTGLTSKDDKDDLSQRYVLFVNLNFSIGRISPISVRPRFDKISQLKIKRILCLTTFILITFYIFNNPNI